MIRPEPIARTPSRLRFAAVAAAVLAMGAFVAAGSTMLHAQGLVEGAQKGAREGNKVQSGQFSMSGVKGASSSNLSLVSNEFTNHSEVDAFYKRMTSRHYAGLVLVETSYSGDHIGADNPSFEDAMVRIFK